MDKLSIIFILLIGIGCSLQKPAVQAPTATVKQHPFTIENITNNSYPTFLSNQARMFLESLSQDTDICSISRNYVPSDKLMLRYPISILQDSIFCISGFLEVDSDFNYGQLKKHHIYCSSGDYLFSTVYIPLYALCDFLKMKGIVRFELVKKLYATLNKARPAVNAQNLFLPLQMSSSFSQGEGCIIGIVDYGFDYTHPDFYDVSGKKYRITQVWEQMNAKGTPPHPFIFGRELKGEEEITAAKTDTESETHGTHVTGIAAGSGAGSMYYGLAPASELILVSTSRTDAGIADALKYIDNYAREKGKPCVINFSLGSSIGPHDGTSYFDRLCDSIIRPGLILTGSAGNNGNQDIYIEKQFLGQPSDTIVSSFLLTSQEQLIADMWGIPNYNFDIQISFVDTVSNRTIVHTPFISTDSIKVHTMQLYNDSSSFIVQMASERHPANQKPTLMIQVNFIDNPYHLVPVLSIRSKKPGFVQGWLTDATFSALNRPEPFMNGNSTHTIGEIGGTGKSIISVGAFCTKSNWTDFSGATYTYGPDAIIDSIAGFSSQGPTADGRIKPDIACPGYGVVSAYNSFFNGNYPPSYYKVLPVSFNQKNYYFGILQGTSEAAPIVAGALAICMQNRPQLTYDEAIHLIRSNARSVTGTILPNNLWGWGILDVEEIIQQLKQ